MKPPAKLPAPSGMRTASLRHFVLAASSALGVIFLRVVAASAQDLYAINYDNSTIEKFTPGGEASLFVSSGLTFPFVLTFDTAGNLYTVNSDGTVLRYGPDGTSSVFSHTGSEGNPWALTSDGSGNLYASYAGGLIQKFAPDGTASVFANSDLNAPYSLTTDAAGNLYAADNETGTVEKFTPGGTASVFATAGPGGFSSAAFFYTSPSFPFPYLYDFGLNSVLYYYPDPADPGHYNTGGVRYFYDFATGKTISK